MAYDYLIDMFLDYMGTYSAIFFGDSGVGKSTFLSKVSYTSMSRDVKPTLGVDNIIFRNDASETLRCWDTGGSDRFVHVVPLFIRKCDVAVYMFDANKPNTFVNIEKWYKLVMGCQDPPKHHVIIGLNMRHDTSVPNFYNMDILDGNYERDVMNEIIQRARHEHKSMDIEIHPAQRQCCFGLCW